MIEEPYRPAPLSNRVPPRWCPVCEGMGGWDKRTYKPRLRRPLESFDTWMTCIVCQQIVRAEYNGTPMLDP